MKQFKSSPASPTKREPECTCLVSEKQQTKLRSMQNRGKFNFLTFRTLNWIRVINNGRLNITPKFSPLLLPYEVMSSMDDPMIASGCSTHGGVLYF